MRTLVKSRKPTQKSMPRFMPFMYGGGGGGTSAAASITTTTRATSGTDNLLISDQYLLLDATSAVSLTLNTPADKQTFFLKITTGDAAVTLTPVSGTIDGAASYVFSGDQSSLGLLFDGTNWHTLLS